MPASVFSSGWRRPASASALRARTRPTLAKKMRLSDCMRGILTFRLAFSQQLLEPDVDHQTEPERLEEVKQRTGRAVQEAEQDEVAIEEIEGRSHEERQAIVQILEPERAFVRGAEQPRRRLPGDFLGPPLEFFAREGFGVAQMLVEIEEDRILLPVPFLERLTEFGHRAAYVHPRVLLERIELRAAPPEQFEQEFRAVSAMLDRTAPEDLPAADVEARFRDLGTSEDVGDLLPQRLGQRLIGLEDQHPLVRDRQVVEPPLEDPRDDPPVLVRQLDDLIGIAAGDLDRPVPALGVEDEDLVREAVHRNERPLDVRLLVAGGDQDGQGDFHESSLPRRSTAASRCLQVAA